MHRSLIVGGGAAGLEVAARLGDRFGKRGYAQLALHGYLRVMLYTLTEMLAGRTGPRVKLH
jgi:NADH dehydrogenase